MIWLILTGFIFLLAGLLLYETAYRKTNEEWIGILSICLCGLGLILIVTAAYLYTFPKGDVL